jgi:Na+/citrate or Na+/malate symporter
MIGSSSWSQMKFPALLGATACAACCAIPLVGLALGAGAASTLAAFVEPIAGASVGVAAVGALAVVVRQRRAATAALQAACPIDGSCGCGG